MSRRPISRVATWLVLLCVVVSGWSPQGLPQKALSAASPVFMLYGSAPNAPDSDLQAIVEGVVKDLPGDWGVAVKKLDTGQYAEFNGDKQQVSASLYKVWVLSELYRQVKAGIVSLDDTMTVTDEDVAYDQVYGDVILNPGDDVTLRHAAELMVTVSDNTSAHLLARMLGPDNVIAFMQRNGLKQSSLDWSGVTDNMTTPNDMLHELELIATSQMVDAQSSHDMVQLLLGQEINNLLTPGLPDGTPFAHKTGALDSLLHDAGIVYSPAGPYIIVCMASNLDDYGTAWDKMPELSKKVYDYFTSRSTSPALYFPQTRQTVAHDFLKAWYEYGGVRNLGYPISAEHMDGDMLVQDFERARFELLAGSAESSGPQPPVELGLLGQDRAAKLGLSWPRTPDPGTGLYFDQTGQAVSGEFLNYWQNNGGEQVFGYPISPSADMVSPVDGKTYMTQWFQRARMEIHPDLPPGDRVVLATLGSELQTPR